MFFRFNDSFFVCTINEYSTTNPSDTDGEDLGFAIPVPDVMGRIAAFMSQAATLSPTNFSLSQSSQTFVPDLRGGQTRA